MNQIQLGKRQQDVSGLEFPASQGGSLQYDKAGADRQL